jgi:glycosyltransferase involved in cell wall biosynthesis
MDDGMFVAQTLRSTILSMRLTVRKSFRIVRHTGWRAFSVKARRKLFPLKVHRAVRARTYGSQALKLAEHYDATPEDLRRSRALTEAHRGRLDIRTIDWFLPDFEHADYGGIRTILRFAAGFTERHGVENTFVVLSDTGAPPDYYAQRIQAAFPALSSARILVGHTAREVEAIPPADACIATHWTTAYAALRDNQTKRKCYLIQDFEPLFFPAGSISAQIEATYRFGFYGITNTHTLQQIYTQEYGGQGTSFQPCVDTELFYPAGARDVLLTGRPQTVFFYGRPDYPRNGFELGIAALRKLKERLGAQVRIVSAGQRWAPADYGLAGVIENLGLLSYAETAALYRECDVGLAMMFTEHPSYLPFELMASGCLVVSNVNSATAWLLKDGQNCLLALPSASCIADALARGLHDRQLRRQITANALRLIEQQHTDWGRQIDQVYRYMCDPEAQT